MAKQETLTRITSQIVNNDEGLITAQIVREILTEITNLLPSDDAEGNAATRSVIDNYLSAGDNISLTMDGGKLTISAEESTITVDDISAVLEGTNPISVNRSGDNLVISVQYANNSRSGVVRLATEREAIAGTSVSTALTPATAGNFGDARYVKNDATYTRYTNKLLSYPDNPDLISAGELRPVRAIGPYATETYNQPLFDSFNITQGKIMVGPSQGVSRIHGVLVGLNVNDGGFDDYVETGLSFTLLDSSDDSVIAQGEITTINQVSNSVLYLVLSESTVNSFSPDTSCHMIVENKVFKAIEDQQIAANEQALEVANAAQLSANTNTAKTADLTVIEELGEFSDKVDTRNNQSGMVRIPATTQNAVSVSRGTFEYRSFGEDDWQAQVIDLGDDAQTEDGWILVLRLNRGFTYLDTPSNWRVVRVENNVNFRIPTRVQQDETYDYYSVLVSDDGNYKLQQRFTRTHTEYHGVVVGEVKGPIQFSLDELYTYQEINQESIGINTNILSRLTDKTLGIGRDRRRLSPEWQVYFVGNNGWATPIQYVNSGALHQWQNGFIAIKGYIEGFTSLNQLSNIQLEGQSIKTRSSPFSGLDFGEYIVSGNFLLYCRITRIVYNNLIRNTQSTFSFRINTTINGASLGTDFAIPRTSLGVPTCLLYTSPSPRDS